jgi:predicted DNA-binding WGR domain protein
VGRVRKTHRKEDSLDGGSTNKAERQAAYQKLQSERVAKGLEEDQERDTQERKERQQILH